MKSIHHPATITWSEEGHIAEVFFPDLPICIAFGTTLEETKAMANEALTGVLKSIVSHDIAFPACKPSDSP
jgi:predicted RNase H-like HicB family nuclease